jgi:hypothetical protein
MAHRPNAMPLRAPEAPRDVHCCCGQACGQPAGSPAKSAPRLGSDWIAQKGGSALFMQINHLRADDRFVTDLVGCRGLPAGVVQFLTRAIAGDRDD